MTAAPVDPFAPTARLPRGGRPCTATRTTNPAQDAPGPPARPAEGGGRRSTAVALPHGTRPRIRPEGDGAR